MKQTIHTNALFAYVNTLCFRNIRPTCTKLSEQFNRNIIYDAEPVPYVSHDKLQRLLYFEGKWNEYLHNEYLHLVSTKKLSQNTKTFLIIDDTILAKKFGRNMDFLNWVFSTSDKQYLLGMNIVFLIWTDGKTRYPIGFRIWDKSSGKSRIDLAMDLLLEAEKILKVNPDYVLMDSFYSASKMLKMISKLGWKYIAKLKSNRLLNKTQVKNLLSRRYGHIVGRLSERIRVIVVKDKDNYWASNDLSLQPLELKKLYKKRQIVEEFFKILKSELHLEGCSSRKLVAQINHIYLVLIAFCKLESFRIQNNLSSIYKLRLILFDCVIPKTFDWNIETILHA